MIFFLLLLQKNLDIKKKKKKKNLINAPHELLKQCNHTDELRLSGLSDEEEEKKSELVRKNVAGNEVKPTSTPDE